MIIPIYTYTYINYYIHVQVMYMKVYLVCVSSKWHAMDEILCYVCAIALLVCIASVLCGMSCFILMCRKGPAGAGRKGEDGGEKVVHL